MLYCHLFGYVEVSRQTYSCSVCGLASLSMHVFISVISKFQIGDKWVNAKKAQDKSKQQQQVGQRGGGGKYFKIGYLKKKLACSVQSCKGSRSPKLIQQGSLKYL